MNNDEILPGDTVFLKIRFKPTGKLIRKNLGMTINVEDDEITVMWPNGIGKHHHEELVRDNDVSENIVREFIRGVLKIIT